MPVSDTQKPDEKNKHVEKGIGKAFTAYELTERCHTEEISLLSIRTAENWAIVCDAANAQIFIILSLWTDLLLLLYVSAHSVKYDKWR